MSNSLLQENAPVTSQQIPASKRRGTFVLTVSLIALVFFAPACKKKRPSLPAQTQPPVLTPEPSGPSVDSLPPPTLPPAATTIPNPPERPKPRRAHKPPNTNKPNASIPAKPPLPSTSKPNPTPDPLAISPDVSRNTSMAQRQSAENLIASAENNINRINRSLSEQEQSMRQQVTNFIQQSRRALQDGDVERGYNLALKASLLSNELTK